MSIRDFPWLADILREAYDKLDQREDEPQDPTWTMGEIVRAANRAQDYINREVQAVSRFWNARVVDTSSIVANSRLVDLPDDCRNVICVSEIEDSEEVQRWVPGRPHDAGATGYTFIHLPEQNQIYLSDTPTTAETLRIWYQPYNPPIVHGIVQTAGATTIQLAEHESFEDDIYNGLDIYIFDGTGQGQTNTISDYVGWSHIAAVTLWTTNPSTDSYYTSRPSLPRDADQAFLYALLCSLVEKNDQEKYGQFLSERAIHMAALKKSASVFEQSGPVRIQNLMPGSCTDPVKLNRW